MSYQQNYLNVLALRAQGNDRVAISELLEKSREIINVVIKSYFKEKEDRNDIAQDFLIQKVYKGVEKFDPERGNYEVWLRKMASCFCLDILRKQKRNVVSYKAETLNYSHEISMRSSYNDDYREDSFLYNQKMLNQALTMLSEKKQRVLKMYFIEKQSYKEIAEQMGATTGVIGVEIQRAKDELKKQLMRLGYKRDFSN